MKIKHTCGFAPAPGQNCPVPLEMKAHSVYPPFPGKAPAAGGKDGGFARGERGGRDEEDEFETGGEGHFVMRLEGAGNSELRVVQYRGCRLREGDGQGCNGRGWVCSLGRNCGEAGDVGCRATTRGIWICECYSLFCNMLEPPTRWILSHLCMRRGLFITL